ncbi:hypothetical protein [Paraburkholderia piptadeniae]|uniref:hypothetical protein n=1 Tax=Paraburkholderia piptadeniae TaxID=1701573 RepID=UPI001356B04A|nr:hypothetical protein [Paraburkholderia piptadeniae]
MSGCFLALEAAHACAAAARANAASKSALVSRRSRSIEAVSMDGSVTAKRHGLLPALHQACLRGTRGESIHEFA